MGQLISVSAKPLRANLISVTNGSLMNTVLANKQYLLIDTRNKVADDGSGVFDAFIVGDGTTKASELELQYLNTAEDVRTENGEPISQFLYSMMQELGDDPNAVVSQKAISEEFAKLGFIRVVSSGEFAYAIIDENDYILWGIRHDGTCYQPKGMPDEVKMRFDELSGWQIVQQSDWLFSIVDKLNTLLFGLYRDGHAYLTNGLTLDGLDAKFTIMHDHQYAFAITDVKGRVLLGIEHSGRVCYTSGMSDEVREIFKQIQFRLGELDGYQIMSNDDFAFCITDNGGHILFGLYWTGKLYYPHGIVNFVTREEYEDGGQHQDNEVYFVQDEPGIVSAVYYNGMLVSSDQTANFFMVDNLLCYRGKATIAPKLWIDHTEMTLNIDYPLNYNGPMFEVIDGLLVIRS